jgi:hypothetical protein
MEWRTLLAPEIVEAIMDGRLGQQTWPRRRPLRYAWKDFAPSCFHSASGGQMPIKRENGKAR